MRAGHDRLWSSDNKHFKLISRDTISRWIWDVLEKTGINTKIFSSHSTRAAATSAAQSHNAYVCKYY